MKKVLTVAMILLVAITSNGQAYDKEILFRNVPWGIDFIAVERIDKEEGYTLMSLSGDWVRRYPIIELIYETEGPEKLKGNINLTAFR